MELFYCPKCRTEFSEIAKSYFYNNIAQINLLFSDTIVDSKSKGISINNVYIILETPCNCGFPLRSVFAPVKELTYIQLDNFRLIHLPVNFYGATLGLFTRKDCKEIIEQYLFRWKTMAHTIVLCSPYIGEKKLDDDKNMSEWNWLFENCEPTKTKIITRITPKKNMKEIKNRIMKRILSGYYPKRKEGIDIDYISQKILKPMFFSDMSIIQFSESHSKFYAGCIGDFVEVIHTSYNLFFQNPDFLENLAVSQISAIDFENKFLKPLGFDKNLKTTLDTTLNPNSSIIIIFGNWNENEDNEDKMQCESYVCEMPDSIGNLIAKLTLDL